MRVLLIGGAGQLGEALQTALQTVPALTLTVLTRQELNLTQLEQLRSAIERTKPAVIINAAAYTAVDRAEAERDLAMLVNGKAPGVMAAAALDCDARLIHISTDYVFAGDKGSPYQETDPTNPLNAYGESKLAGEQAILDADADAVIVRTAWVYGAGGKGNFVKTMLRLGAERSEVRVVADQIGTPTWTGDLAKAITTIAGATETPIPAGIYHYTNSGVASWYDFAIAIFEEAAALGLPLSLNRVVPITTSEYPTPARRPAYSVLACGKINSYLGGPAPHWRQGLRTMLSELQTAR